MQQLGENRRSGNVATIVRVFTIMITLWWEYKEGYDNHSSNRPHRGFLSIKDLSPGMGEKKEAQAFFKTIIRDF